MERKVINCQTGEVTFESLSAEELAERAAWERDVLPNEQRKVAEGGASTLIEQKPILSFSKHNAVKLPLTNGLQRWPKSRPAIPTRRLDPCPS